VEDNVLSLSMNNFQLLRMYTHREKTDTSTKERRSFSEEKLQGEYLLKNKEQEKSLTNLNRSY
jgi:hypothetical protein